MNDGTQVGDTNRSPVATLEDLRLELASLKAKVDHSEKTWTPSVLIALAAFLFSFGTTCVSYLKAQQEDVQSARGELRSLIEQLDTFPIQNLDYSEKYATKPDAQRSISGLLNGENALLSKQAYDVIEKIPAHVSSSEYLNVANALVQSDLSEKALELYKDGVAVANDSNDELGLLRSYANLLFLTGSVEEGRHQYELALQVFQHYSGESNYVIESSHFLTELGWAGAEANIRRCDYAEQHLERADQHLSALPPGSMTASYAASYSQLRAAMVNCRP